MKNIKFMGCRLKIKSRYLIRIERRGYIILYCQNIKDLKLSKYKNLIFFQIMSDVSQ